jgi:hypothetical protein
MTRNAVLAAIVKILRPVTRLLLRYGVAYGEFCDLAKWVFVDVAAKEFGVPRRKQSNSRVSIITGLSRKEVLRLRTVPEPSDESAVERYNRAARVISAWVRDARFCDEAGNPSILALDGADNSFAELVRLFGGDVPPRAVLDELNRVGAVERVDRDQVRLLTRAYVPSAREGELDKLAILGTDVAALVSTIDHNLQAGPGEAYFQRKVSYEGMTATVVPELREESAARAQALLEELDELYADKLRRPGGEAGRKRILMGAYYWEEEMEPAEQPEERRDRFGPVADDVRIYEPRLAQPAHVLKRDSRRVVFEPRHQHRR